MEEPPNPWVNDPAAVAGAQGKIRHALFDFDGTLSLLRQGWEEVMISHMMQAIGKVDGKDAAELEREAARYVEGSAGELTIEQMKWLASWIRSHGKMPAEPGDYKVRYARELRSIVNGRLEKLDAGDTSRDDLLVRGALAFMDTLSRHHVELSLASGTDHSDVVHEAAALGVEARFEGRLCGALDYSGAHGKEQIVEDLVRREGLRSGELLVIGDGPVEIRCAAKVGAIGLGIASDERYRSGWDPAKIRRLVSAGASILVPDYSQGDAVARLLWPTNYGAPD